MFTSSHFAFWQISKLICHSPIEFWCSVFRCIFPFAVFIRGTGGADVGAGGTAGGAGSGGVLHSSGSGSVVLLNFVYDFSLQTLCNV